MYFIIAIMFIAIPVVIAGIQLFVGQRHADQAAVLWTMAIALEKQLPLSEELDAVAGTLSRRHAEKTRRLAKLLSHGDSLSDALGKVPGVIPQSAILTAQISEQNDALPAAIKDAAIRHTKSGPGNGSGLSTISLVYPVVLLMFAMLLFSFLTYFIIPKYKKIFADMGVEFPGITNDVMQAADVLIAIPFVPFILIGLPVVIGVWTLNAYCRGFGERDIPLVGRWFRRLDVPEILRNLATTVAAEKPLEESLLLLSRRHHRRAVRNALTAAYEKFRQGDDCWYALCDARLLDNREVAALRSAQRVGNLPWVLRQLARTIDRRISYRWLSILEVAQPAAVLGLGVIVGAIVLSFFVPLVSLIQELC